MCQGIGHVRFHAQALPIGRIKSCCIVKRASGWYLCLFIEALKPHRCVSAILGAIGLDPGFYHLLTLSNGEKIAHPHELRQTARRLAQAQRGGRKRLTARLQERLANQRKDRNHKLSRRLVADNQRLVWSKVSSDRHRQSLWAERGQRSTRSTSGHARLQVHCKR